MRWERLFGDLDAQFAARRQAGIEGDSADEAQWQVARGTMAQRLAGHTGRPVRLVLASGRPVEGTCRAVGAGWVLVASAAEDHLIPWTGLGWWEPTSRRLPPASEPRTPALGWGTVLRALQRRREHVRVVHLLGATEWESAGTLEAVGADYVQLRPAPPGELGAAATGPSRILPLGQVLAVVSRAATEA